MPNFINGSHAKQIRGGKDVARRVDLNPSSWAVAMDSGQDACTGGAARIELTQPYQSVVKHEDGRQRGIEGIRSGAGRDCLVCFAKDTEFNSCQARFGLISDDGCGFKICVRTQVETGHL